MVGKNNRYGHPHQGALIGAKVYRTDVNGTVIVLTDGKHYKIKTGK